MLSYKMFHDFFLQLCLIVNHFEPEGGLWSKECAASRKHLEVSRFAADDPWKSQPWPAVFTFPSRGQGLLEQIPFVQILSTHPAGVASIPTALR